MNMPLVVGKIQIFFIYPAKCLEMGQVKSDHNLTSYTRQQVEQRLANTYAVYFGNNSQRVLNIFESNYLPNGTADDDHVAWLQFVVDVRNTYDIHYQWEGTVRKLSLKISFLYEV